MVGPEDEDDEYRQPLPPDDRVWRHPAEVAADLRATGAAFPTALRTPLRHAAVYTAVGALGGALVVTGLFLTIGPAAPRIAPAAEPAVVNIALDPVVPIEVRVNEADWAETVTERVAPAVAVVRVGDRTGSGVVFQSDGLLLTSNDLVDGATDVVVGLGGSEIEGRVLGSDPISGLSVIEIDHRDLESAPLAIFKQPAIGDLAVVLAGATPGDDLEMGTLSANSGKVRVSSSRNLHGLLQLDTPLPDRGSGAALIDDTGAVIGIVIDVGTDNATYAVPIGWARKIADDIIVWGEGRHPWLGVTGVDLDRETRDDAGIDAGVRVESVISDGPANIAGIERGDYITRIGDRRIASMSDLILELRRHPPDQAIEVSLYRDGAAQDLLVRLGQRDDDRTE